MQQTLPHPAGLGLLVVLGALSAVSPTRAGDFRQFDWGTPKELVRANEDLPIHHDLDHEIAYWNFKLAGFPAGLVYHFEDGKLARAHYLSRNPTPVAAEDYENYLAFQKHFDGELGPHLEETWQWADGEEHGEAEQTLDAVTAGRATVITRWAYTGTEVRMELVGGEGAMQSLRVYFEPSH